MRCGLGAMVGVCAVALMGCGEAPVAEDPTFASDPVCDGLEVAAISSLRFARAEKGVSTGFDLDGTVTGTSSGGCGGADLVSPEGIEGIDNALGSLLPALDGTEAVALEPLIASFIAEGELLLLVELAGHLGSDPTCATMNVLRGAGTPLINTQSTLLAGQTFVLDPEIPVGEPAVAWIEEDGSLRGEGLSVDVPFEIFGGFYPLSIRNAVVRATPRSEAEGGGYVGIMSGAVDYAPLLEGLLNAAIDPALASLLQFAMPAAADLSLNGDGECDALSAVLVFEAVPAFIYDGVPPVDLGAFAGTGEDEE